MQITGANSPSKRRSPATTSPPSGLPGGDPCPRRHDVRGVRLPDPLRLDRHPDGRDELDVLVRDESGGAAGESQGPADGGLIVADRAAFTERNLLKAGYPQNPLADDTLAPYRVLRLDITKLTEEAVKEFGVTAKEAHRCRNMWALGLLLWMYGREHQATIAWLEQKFAAKPAIMRANVAAVRAGHAFGETAELTDHVTGYTIAKADVAPGLYRTVTGTEAIAWGLLAGLRAAGLEKLVFAGYPITPASALLHTLAGLKLYGVVTFQAEDEIAAIGAALGASYAGALGVTSSSGPGVALKRRCWPRDRHGAAARGDQFAARGPVHGHAHEGGAVRPVSGVHGRNADAPLVVLAASSPADCFEVAIEAVRLATTYMTPVILLSDGYLAHAAEPWRVPDLSSLPRHPIRFRTDPTDFQPFMRDPETLARAWAVPGTPGLQHRIGGLEKSADTGHISYDPENHQRMTTLRAAKIAGIARDIPEQRVALGQDRGALAVVGWGSTFGPIHQAVRQARAAGLDVSHIHLRHLAPFSRNLGDLLRRFDRILVPEMNAGQLVQLLRAAYLVPAEGLNQVTGKPFRVATILEGIRASLNGGMGNGERERGS